MTEGIGILLICLLPLAMIFGIVALAIWAGGRGGTAAKLRAMQTEILGLRAANVELGRRLGTLEQQVVEATGPASAAPTFPGVARPRQDAPAAGAIAASTVDPGMGAVAGGGEKPSTTTPSGAEPAVEVATARSASVADRLGRLDEARASASVLLGKAGANAIAAQSVSDAAPPEPVTAAESRDASAASPAPSTETMRSTQGRLPAVSAPTSTAPQAVPSPASPAAAVLAAGTSPIHAGAPPAASPPRSFDGPTPPAGSNGNTPIQWERWLGVVGAAALGAAVLVIAGIYFFKYSVEHGLLTPTLRVVLGTVAGLGCVVASEWPLRRRYQVLANWLAGAGIAILYLAFWSAAAAFHLVPNPVGWVLMVVVTLTCGVLAVHRRSMTIALLGLLGGFATPMLLSTGQDRPIALFSYLLLLDGALLYLARVQRWPAVGVLALGGTFVYQTLWIVGRMDADRTWIGLAVAATFGALFALFPGVAGKRSGSSADADDQDDSPATPSGGWQLLRVGGVLSPFAFALYFALQSKLGPHLYPAAIVIGLQCLMAAWAARVHGFRWLLPTATAAAMGVVCAFVMVRTLSLPLAWEVMGVLVGLAAIPHVALEFFHAAQRRAPSSSLDADRADAAHLAAILVSIGGLGLTVLKALAMPAIAPWPWLVGWLLIIGLVHRQARLGFAGIAVFAVGLHAFGVIGLPIVHGALPGVPSLALYLGLVFGQAILLQFLALSTAKSDRGKITDHGAALFAMVSLTAMGPLAWEQPMPSALYFAMTIGLMVLVGLSAARIGRAHWWMAACVALALSHSLWSAIEVTGAPSSSWLDGLFGHGGALIVASMMALFLPKRLREDRWLWRATALLPVLLFVALRQAYLDGFGDRTIGILPVGLSLFPLANLLNLRFRPVRDASVGKSAVVWLAATALGFVTAAIPMQLENQWVTIGWALEGVALLLLWRRLDHAGLKYFAVVLLAGATTRLVANPYVLDYLPPSGMPILNWISYTYLVPALCLMGGWMLLRQLEPARWRPWERSVYPKEQPLLALGLVFAAIVVVFAWLNLSIIDVFAEGDHLTIPFERMPARDLSISIAWACYGLVLLAIGMWRSSIGLRAISLGLTIITAFKVFLYDLAHLHDLYRVGALVGLAISLIAISFAYQRFVFRRPVADGSAT